MRLAFAEAVLGRNRAAELHGLAREFEQDFRGLRGFFLCGQNVYMQVRVADVSEDHISPAKFLVEPGAIKLKHLAIALHGHGAIGTHFQAAGAAQSLVHQFRQAVAEHAKPLAVRG